MFRSRVFPALVAGLYAAAVSGYPFTGLTAETLFLSWVVFTASVSIFVALGKRVAKDFSLDVRFRYGIAFFMFFFALAAVAFLLLPEFMAENGQTLVEHGRLTMAGLFRIVVDAVLISTAVFVHGLVLLLLREYRLNHSNSAFDRAAETALTRGTPGGSSRPASLAHRARRASLHEPHLLADAGAVPADRPEKRLRVTARVWREGPPRLEA